ncbi:MAG: diguanylate cyclase domain-containing protein [Pseudomonadota bacterium]
MLGFLPRQVLHTCGWPYACAVLLTVAAALAVWLWLPSAPLLLFLSSTLLSALLGGRGPGALALALSLPLLMQNSLPRDPADWNTALLLRLGTYVLLSVFCIALMHRLRRTLQERQAQRSAESFLAEAGAVLVASLDFETALRQLARLAVTQFSDWCLVTVVEPDHSRPVLVIAGKEPGHEAWTQRLEQTFRIDAQGRYGSGKAIATGKPILIEHFTDEHLAILAPDPEQFALFKRMQNHSYLTVPMLARGRILGSIAFGLSTARRRFGRRDVILAEELARRAALAVDNALLYRQAREAENALRDSERALRRAYAFREQVMESARHSIFALDLEGRFVLLNRAGAAIAGYAVEELLGRPFAALFSPAAAAPLSALFEQIIQQAVTVTDHEVMLTRKDGTQRLISVSASPLYEDGRVIHVVGTAEDVTDRKEAERRLAHLAHCDPLTGLPNRALLQDRLEHALAHAKRHGRQAAVLFLDLDGFKQVNDVLGHAAGDELLRQIAERLREAAREDDTVARLGGDEFVILLEEVMHEAEAAEIAQRLLAALAEPITLMGREVQVTSSIGITLYPRDGENAPALLKHADSAMYRAKRQGRNKFQFFTTAAVPLPGDYAETV